MKTCGGCTACCHTVPVGDLKLRAWQGCPFERRVPAHPVGCGIYATRPECCVAWNCQWLAQTNWPDHLRPDRCGVVVDIMPDTFGLVDNETGESVEKAAMQFWVDRGHENDWQDPESPVQDLIGKVTKAGMAVLWRTFDPVHGQQVRAFWLDAAGNSCTCDPGPPTRTPYSADTLQRALALMAKR